MAFDVTASARAVQSHLEASGRFVHVQIGEPKNVVDQAGFVAAIFNESMRVVGTTMGATIQQHVLTIRLYRNMLAEPEESIELEGSLFVSAILSLFLGDFELGGSIRNVDVAGQEGQALEARWAYGDVSGKLYRLADITLPLIVDGTAGELAA